MKILLVTIHNAVNYGAVLQTFAMKKILENYGEVEVLNYDNKHISIDFQLIRVKLSIHGFLGLMKDIFRIIPRKKVLTKFNDFLNKNFKLTELVDKNTINKIKKFDIYVAGSDQIWNPKCVSENSTLDSIYFLSFAPANSNKTSYASSFGSYIFNTSEEENIKDLLKDFHTISVREIGSKNYLENILNREISHVLDPTLLLNKEQWINSFGLKEKKEKEKYILIYSVPKTKLIEKVAKYIKEKLNLKIIAIDQGLTTVATVDKQIRDAGPIEYLDLFLNAEFIITDSFHGTCFSLNFNKNFISVAPGIHSNRIESLLTLVGLKSQLVTNENDLHNISNNLFYDKINMKIDKIRENSINYLDNMII